MAKTFRKSDSYMRSLVEEVMRLYHPDLIEYKISVDLIDAYDSGGGAAVVHGGRPAYAVIRSIPLKDRVMGRGDAEITFDALVVGRMTERQRKALIDHELYHLEFKLNKDGEKTVDDLGRYLFKMRPHDREFGWFESVAMRWGRDSVESKQAREMVEDEYFKRYFLLEGLSDKEELGTEATFGEKYEPEPPVLQPPLKICGPVVNGEVVVTKVVGADQDCECDNGVVLPFDAAVLAAAEAHASVPLPLPTGPDVVESSMRFGGVAHPMFVAPDGSDVKSVNPPGVLAPPDQWHVSPPEIVEVGVNAGLEVRSVAIPGYGVMNKNNDIFPPGKVQVPIDNVQFQHGTTSLEDEFNRHLKK